MYSYNVIIDGDEAAVTVDETRVTFSLNKEEVCIAFDNFISVEVRDAGEQKVSFKLHYIKQTGLLLSKNDVKICGQAAVARGLLEILQEKCVQVSSLRPKHFLVVVNPIGGKARAEKDFKEKIKPLFDLGDITCDVFVSERPNHCTEFLESHDLNDIDAIAVLGGDGTVSEVANALLKKTMTTADLDYNDPKVKVPVTSIPIGHIPTGSYNVMVTCCFGAQDIITATLAIIKGDTRPMGVGGVYSGGRLLYFSLVGVANGIIADMVNLRDKNRGMGWLRLIWTPLRMLLFDRLRSFTAEITIQTSEKTVVKDGDEEKTTFIEKEEKFEGDMCNMLTMCWSPKDVNGKIQPVPIRGPYQTFTIQKMPCSKFQLVRNLYRMFSFKTEEVQGDNAEHYKAAGYEMTIKADPPSDDNLSINIDGDAFTLPEPKFEYRYNSNSLLMFSNLTDTEDS